MNHDKRFINVLAL